MKKILLLLTMALFVFANDEPEKIPNDIQVGVAVGQFKIHNSEFNELSFEIGARHFLDGRENDGFTYGLNYTIASGTGTYSGYSYSIEEKMMLLEGGYTKNFEGGIIIPTLVVGRLTETIDSSVLTSKDTWTVKGVGVYFSPKEFIRDDRRIELFAKRLKINNELNKSITIAGVKYTW